MKIVITTGIYPPQIGGPAEYARCLKDALENAGHSVSVKTYALERFLPTGIRHLYYFLKIIPVVFLSRAVIALDTWSTGVPAVYAGWIFRKKTIVRVGGDFLWESYVERTQKSIPLSRFYDVVRKFTFKEKIIFSLTRRMLHKANTVVFSTPWQRDIWREPYELSGAEISVIENYIGERVPPIPPTRKNFMWPVRPLFLKNGERLKTAFIEATREVSGLALETETMPHEELLERMRRSYAVILPSLSEISPNLILDAIRVGKPFILTRECGYYDMLKDIGVFVDPLDIGDIKEKILYLSDETNYNEISGKIRRWDKTHSWEEVANEFVSLLQNER